jgi:hypothetical protein
MKILSALLLLFASSSFASTTYYIRTDGGDSTHCSGLVDAPYSGNVFNRACAFHHPFDVLPPNLDGNDTKNKPLMQGGDTLIIGPGSYQMGLPYGAGIYESCKTSWPYDCHMQPVPSGNVAQPTRIMGAGYANCPSGIAAPTFWGSGGAGSVLNLTGSNNVFIECLEVTDHSACIQNHPNAAIKCQAGGAWASNGITDTDGRASNIPSTNVTLQDLNIHGLAHYGVLAGNISGWTVKNVKLNANGFGGWSTDLSPAYSVSTGQNTFTTVEIAWNGCTENYPTTAIWGCWGQQSGGYGDGFGSSSSSDKGTWLFQSLQVHDNTQDGLDFLHADPSAVITFDHVNAYRNAGNQIKGNGNVSITNSVVSAYCSVFAGLGDMVGNNGAGGATSGDLCRALGDAVVVGMVKNGSTTIANNTIISQGNCLITVPDSGVGDSTSKLNVSQNILIGLPVWVDGNQTPPPQSCLYYWNSANVPSFSGNVIWKVKGETAPAGNLYQDPKLTNETLAAFDPTPTAATPPNVGAIRGTVVTPPVCPAVCIPKLVCTNTLTQSACNAVCQ